MGVRDVMPFTARKIASFRREKGAAIADGLIRRALAGEPGLFLSLENHRSFGTPPLTNHICSWGENEQFRRVADPAWMIDAAAFALTLGIEIEVVDVSDFDEAVIRANKLRDILRKVSYA